MAGIIKILRTHPKKSIFFCGVSGFGINYAKRKIEESDSRRHYCAAATPSGHEKLSPFLKPQRITIFYNGRAGKGNTTKYFEKDVVPFFHLSGYEVQLVKTGYAGEAKDYLRVLNPSTTDSILVAGGDGTLLEVISGLLSRTDFAEKCSHLPVSVVPLGKTNSFVSMLLGGRKIDSENKSKLLHELSSKITSQSISEQNVIEITTAGLEEQKIIHSLCGLQWSIDNDIRQNAQKRWYFGPFRLGGSYILASLTGAWKNKKEASIKYTKYCHNCEKCVKQPLKPKPVKGSILTKFYGKKYSETPIRKIPEANEDCGVEHEVNFSGRGMILTQNQNHLVLSLVPAENSVSDFLKTSWDVKNSKPYLQSFRHDGVSVIEADSFVISPTISENENYSIDNEAFESYSVHVKLCDQKLRVCNF